MGIEDFYLSNSMLRDWEDMCKIQWKDKWLNGNSHYDIDHKQAVRWGIFFETLVIGSGMGGKTIELTKEERDSVYYERIKIQAKRCREYLDMQGGKIIGRQLPLKAEFEHNGSIVKASGNIDIRYQYVDVTKSNIDLKLTGKTDNTFGKFAWGSPERMDMSQMIQYALLCFLVYGEVVKSQYWVFDTSPAMEFLPINVIISDWAMEAHKERLARVYDEITESMILDYWQPVNTWANCRDCPIECKHRVLMPEFINIEK